jgi:hypothetical protein
MVAKIGTIVSVTSEMHTSNSVVLCIECSHNIFAVLWIDVTLL